MLDVNIKHLNKHWCAVVRYSNAMATAMRTGAQPCFRRAYRHGIRVTASQHPQASVSSMATSVHPRAAAILAFWFGDDYATASSGWYPEEHRSKWFGSHVDQHIAENFAADREAVVSGQHDTWLGHPLNAMAGVIALDQFTRNLNRGSPRSWESDVQALAWAQSMLALKQDEQLPLAVRAFIGLPFMHSEELKDQEECVRLMAKWHAEAQALPDAHPGLAPSYAGFHKYAILHRDVVAKWGRFPHRNAVLGRPSTEAEVQGLADGSIPKF